MKCLVIMAAAASLGGCATLNGDYRTTGRELNGSYPWLLADEAVPRTEFNQVAWSDDSARRAAVRRDLIHGLVARSDIECEDYLIGISVETNRADAGLSLGGLALGAASVLATPERSSKLLGQLSTLTGTSALALRDTVFAGRDYQIIYAAIQTGRRRDRQAIFDRVEANAFADWGYESMVAAVTSYHLNCGLTYGLQQLTEAIEEQARRDANVSGNPQRESAIDAPDLLGSTR